MRSATTHSGPKFGIKIPKLFPGWQQVFGEARTRVFLWYLLILGITFLIAIPAFRYQLYQRIDERVHQDMEEDMRAFKALIVNKTFALEDKSANDDLEDMALESKKLRQMLSEKTDRSSCLQRRLDAAFRSLPVVSTAGG